MAGNSHVWNSWSVIPSKLYQKNWMQMLYRETMTRNRNGIIPSSFYLIRKKGLASKDAILDVLYKKQIGRCPMEIEFRSRVKRAAIFLTAISDAAAANWEWIFILESYHGDIWNEFETNLIKLYFVRNCIIGLSVV